MKRMIGDLRPLREQRAAAGEVKATGRERAPRPAGGCRRPAAIAAAAVLAAAALLAGCGSKPAGSPEAASFAAAETAVPLPAAQPASAGSAAEGRPADSRPAPSPAASAAPPAAAEPASPPARQAGGDAPSPEAQGMETAAAAEASPAATQAQAPAPAGAEEPQPAAAGAGASAESAPAAPSQGGAQAQEPELSSPPSPSSPPPSPSPAPSPTKQPAGNELTWAEFFDDDTQSTPSNKFWDLNGKTVQIKGFMGEVLSFDKHWFLLIPQPGAECPFDNGDETYWNKIMIVFVPKDTKLRYTSGALQITGRLDVGIKIDESGYKTMFRLYDAKFEKIKE